MEDLSGGLAPSRCRTNRTRSLPLTKRFIPLRAGPRPPSAAIYLNRRAPDKYPLRDAAVSWALRPELSPLSPLRTHLPVASPNGRTG